MHASRSGSVLATSAAPGVSARWPKFSDAPLVPVFGPLSRLGCCAAQKVLPSAVAGDRLATGLYS